MCLLLSHVALENSANNPLLKKGPPLAWLQTGHRSQGQRRGGQCRVWRALRAAPRPTRRSGRARLERKRGGAPCPLPFCCRPVDKVCDSVFGCVRFLYILYSHRR